MLPEWFFISVSFIFGLVIGSFLNVVIYRLHTGRSLNDRSHCLSCEHTLSWYELFPVFSYLLLKGRCKECGAFIPHRYALVELLTALMFVMAYVTSQSIFELVLTCGFLSVLIVGAVYDFYHMIIPDEVSGGLAVLAGLLVSYKSFILGDLSVLLSALLASFIAFIFFAGLWYFSGGRALGFGDAKLSIGLGALVGLGGVFSLLVLAFWLGAIISLSWMLINYIAHMLGKVVVRHRVRMKSEIPFAPFLILSFVLVYFLKTDVLVWSEYLFNIFVW